jgi:hypothetical protein
MSISSLKQPGGRRLAALLAVSLLIALSPTSFAQQPQPDALPGGQPPVNAAVADFGLGGVGVGNNGGGGNLFAGGAGGAANADFDSLIDLITSTVEADSWEENGTGEGEIQPFPTGVWIDATGALRVDNGDAGTAGLAAIRARGARGEATPPAADATSPATANPRRHSALRYVSLPRLEAAIIARQAEHLPLDPAMLTLAGLERVEFVLVYPETGDLVLAGPAGDWQVLRGGGLISAETGRPIARLDDMLALWRRQRLEQSAAFGCSIVPRQDALARTQEFLNASAAEPIEPSQRREWLEELRATLGLQDVEYYNIDPNSRVAGLLLAADYHMKLVGMGLAEGVPGVKSYLATVRLGPGGQAPPMSVLRWWFSMPTTTVAATAERDAFSLPDNCVQVLSENEMLAARGERVHTGQSDDLTSGFAKSFTAEFAALSEKYPIYGQLARVFELSLALALVEKEGLAAKVGWSPELFLDPERLRLPGVNTPKAVETVINHRVIGGRHIIAGVSGGVWVDGGQSLAVAPADASAATTLASMRADAPEAPRPPAVEDGEIVWWWD